MRSKRIAPILILGVPRSGTTLLRVLLDSHSMIAGAPETGWLTGGYGDFSIRKLVESLIDDKIGAVKTMTGVGETTVIRSAQNFIDVILKAYLSRSRKKYLALKTPDDIRYLEFLNKLFPKTKYIHIYRDGRDVACSTFFQKGKFFGDHVLKEFGELTIINSLRRWVDWENKVLNFKKISKHPSITVKYENLINDPEKVLTNVCKFLQVPFEPSMVNYHNYQHEFPDWEAGSVDVKNKKSLVKESIGRWKKEIPYSDWNTVDEIAGKLLIEHGYKTCLDQAEVDRNLILQAIKQLKLESEQLRINLFEKEKTIKNANKESEEFKKKISVREKKISIVKSNTDQIIFEKDKRWQEALKDIENLKTKISEADEKLLEKENNLQEQKATADKQLNKMEQSLQTALNDIESLKAQISEGKKLLKQQRATANEQLLEKEKKQQAASKEIKALKEQLSESEKRLQEQKATADKQLLDRENSLQAALEDIDRLKATISENKMQQCDQLRYKDELINKKKERIQHLDNLLKERVHEIKNIKSILEKKNNELTIFYNSRTFGIMRIIGSTKIYSLLRGHNKHSSIQIKSISAPSTVKLSQRKIKFGDQLEAHFGTHRSGWKYAIKSLKPLHNPEGILLDTFIERTFFWHSRGIKPHSEPWIGFVHVPPGIPKWFQYEQSNEFIFQSKAFRESLPFCKGLFTLSAYHKEILMQQFDIPVDNLIHPTEFPKIQWSWNRFKKNKEKKIVHIGWWLRKYHSIYLLPKTRFKKIILKKDDANVKQLMKLEIENEFGNGTFNEAVYNNAQTVSFLPNDEYDLLISENIVFLHLYGSSANNTLIECIVRNTPVLVNPLPSVIEYLGEDYPFYFNSLEEAADKAEDFHLIRKTHKYLTKHHIKKKLTGKYFRDSFKRSEIYKSL